MIHHYGGQSGDYLKKQGLELTYDPRSTLPGIYNEKTMFAAALFTIARTWKQPRCPLTDEWIKKLWYIYTMEYYSAIKRNALELVLMRWINLESIYRVK